MTKAQARNLVLHPSVHTILEDNYHAGVAAVLPQDGQNAYFVRVRARIGLNDP